MKAKRVFDIVFSGIGLVLFSPLMCVVAVVVLFDTPGPILFRQLRVGRNGVPFRIHKFRTMVSETRPAGLLITAAADPRVTRSGAILRRYKLDELPQLYDVFRGKMSLVGPRPEVPKYVDLYPEASRMKVLSVRPGITDPASIAFLDEAALLEKADDPEREYVSEILPQKIAIYEQYVATRSLWGDVRIILTTLYRIFRA